MTVRYLVLAELHDRGAATVAQRLAGLHGGEAVARISLAGLGGSRWVHTVSTAGRCDTTIGIADGRAVEAGTLLWVLNRMASPPAVPQFATASAKDRDYAGAEFQALLTSWLASLGARVVNPVGAGALLSVFGPSLAWMAQADAAGLSVRPSHRATPGMPVPGAPALDPGQHAAAAGDHVLVAGSEALGPLAGDVGPQCVELSRRLGLVLAAFHFVPAGGRPELVGINSIPPLTGEGEVAAVVRLAPPPDHGAGAP